MTKAPTPTEMSKGQSDNEIIASLFKREFQIFFFLWLLEKGLMIEDIVNIRNECLIFLRSSRDLSRASPKFISHER